MPSYIEYLSDASVSSSEEEEEDVEDVYCPRELDYWALEEHLEEHRPPPVIEYVEKLGVFALREAIVSPLTAKIDSVVPSASVNTWKTYWQKKPQANARANFSHEDWDAIASFCFGLCEKCDVDVTMQRVRSCMIRILSHGKFKDFIGHHL